MAGLWSAEEDYSLAIGVSGAADKCEFTCSYLWGPSRDSERRSQDDCSRWWMVIDDEKCIQAYLSANSDETLMTSIRSRCDISFPAAGVLFFLKTSAFCSKATRMWHARLPEVMGIRGHVVLITSNINLEAVCRHSQTVMLNLPVRRLAEKCYMTHLSRCSITNLLSELVKDFMVFCVFCAVAYCSCCWCIYTFCLLDY